MLPRIWQSEDSYQQRWHCRSLKGYDLNNDELRGPYQNWRKTLKYFCRNESFYNPAAKSNVKWKWYILLIHNFTRKMPSISSSKSNYFLWKKIMQNYNLNFAIYKIIFFHNIKCPFFKTKSHQILLSLLQLKFWYHWEGDSL